MPRAAFSGRWKDIHSQKEEVRIPRYFIRAPCCRSNCYYLQCPHLEVMYVLSHK